MNIQVVQCLSACFDIAIRLRECTQDRDDENMFGSQRYGHIPQSSDVCDRDRLAAAESSMSVLAGKPSTGAQSPSLSPANDKLLEARGLSHVS